MLLCGVADAGVAVNVNSPNVERAVTAGLIPVAPRSWEIPY
jgi:hypothetical protein